MKKKVDSFKLGDLVTWKSGAQGSYTDKLGKVVAIVAASENPPFERWIDSHSYTVGQGRNRSHESYLVSVPSPEGSRAMPKLYWPRVSGLYLAQAGPGEGRKKARVEVELAFRAVIDVYRDEDEGKPEEIGRPQWRNHATSKGDRDLDPRDPRR